MVFHTYDDDDGTLVWEFDREGIEYLIEGLERLKDMDPGDSLTAPSVVNGPDKDSPPEAVSEHILLRAQDQ